MLPVTGPISQIPNRIRKTLERLEAQIWQVGEPVVSIEKTPPQRTHVTYAQLDRSAVDRAFDTDGLLGAIHQDRTNGILLVGWEDASRHRAGHHDIAWRPTRRHTVVKTGGR
jgi:hypothetical protein